MQRTGLLVNTIFAIDITLTIVFDHIQDSCSPVGLSLVLLVKIYPHITLGRYIFGCQPVVNWFLFYWRDPCAAKKILIVVQELTFLSPPLMRYIARATLNLRYKNQVNGLPSRRDFNNYENLLFDWCIYRQKYPFWLTCIKKIKAETFLGSSEEEKIAIPSKKW